MPKRQKKYTRRKYPCPLQRCNAVRFSLHNLRRHMKTTHAEPTPEWTCGWEGCREPPLRCFEDLERHCDLVHMKTEYNPMPSSDIKWKPHIEGSIELVNLEPDHSSWSASPSSSCTSSSCTSSSSSSSLSTIDVSDSDLDDDEKPPRSYVCDKRGCGKSFKTHSGLKLHTDSVHIGIRYKCHWKGCNRSFTQNHTLKRHIAKVHRRQSDSSDSESSDF